MSYNQLKELADEKFRRLTGIKRATFEKMVSILNLADQAKKKRGGRKNKLSIEDQLLMALEYLREYRTYFHIGRSYGLSESTTYKRIKWIEETLIKHPDFALPGRKALLKAERENEIILIDARESPVERTKKQRKYYSDKKKRHTIKTQVVVVDKGSKEVVCTSFCKGRRQDFGLFKRSKVYLQPDIKILTDSGYQGIAKVHSKVEIPKKRSGKQFLTKEEREYNQELTREREANENVIGKLKRCKIIADRYRNRRKRFGIRFNLHSRNL